MPYLVKNRIDGLVGTGSVADDMGVKMRNFWVIVNLSNAFDFGPWYFWTMTFWTHATSGNAGRFIVFGDSFLLVYATLFGYAIILQLGSGRLFAVTDFATGHLVQNWSVCTALSRCFIYGF